MSVLLAAVCPGQVEIDQYATVDNNAIVVTYRGRRAGREGCGRGRAEQRTRRGACTPTLPPWQPPRAAHACIPLSRPTSLGGVPPPQAFRRTSHYTHRTACTAPLYRSATNLGEYHHHKPTHHASAFEGANTFRFNHDRSRITSIDGG